MLGKIIWSILLFAGGVGLIAKTKRVKDFTGNFDFAEKWFGIGGTYSFLKLVGVLLMIFAFLWVTGTFGRIIPDFLLSTPR